MGLEEIKAAQKHLKNSRQNVIQEAKRAIKWEVQQLLAEPDIEVVSWAQKTSEYTDEGMYPGVFGPAFNQPYSTSEDRWDSFVYEWDFKIDPRGETLREILLNVGDEILSEIFEDESAVDATVNNLGNIDFRIEYAGV